MSEHETTDSTSITVKRTVGSAVRDVTEVHMTYTRKDPSEFMTDLEDFLQTFEDVLERESSFKPAAYVEDEE